MDLLNSLRLHRLLPPRRWIRFFVINLVVFCGVDWFARVGIYWMIGIESDQVYKPAAYNVLLGMGLVFLAFWRTGTLNPVSNGQYRRWLSTTPWTHERELPFGPVLLVWQDAIIFGVAMLLWTAPVHRLYLLLAFFAPYCLAMTWSNLQIRAYKSVYLAIFLATWIPFTLSNPWLTALVMTGIYICCQVGFQSKLDQFPWDDCLTEQSVTESKDHVGAETWPMVNFGRILKTEQLVPMKHVLGISFSLAWIATVIVLIATIYMKGLPERMNLQTTCSSVLALFGLIVSMNRLGIYVSGRESPLGAISRLATGRLIIPGYDKIFLVPLLVLVVGLVIPASLYSATTELPIAAMTFVHVFAVLALALGCPPSLPMWSFTGDYRMAKGKPPRANKSWVHTA